MQILERFQEVRTGFTRNFWVANTLELFERFAFYGSKAILAVYLADKVGLGPLGNRLVGTYGFAIFFLPILAGTVVDRYGFRRSLLACFSIFSIGYFSIGLAGMPFARSLVDSIGARNYVIIALALTAIGGSLIKPCIVGTVARTTTDSTKSLGYSIYYTLVNVGGFLGPVLASQVRSSFGIEFVLVSSSLTSLLLLAGTFFFFDEPQDSSGEAAGPARTMKAVLEDMGLVFLNSRFITFLVIFSGFWIMFWQIFYAVPFFARDVLKIERWELMESVGPFTIIFLTVPMTALMKRVKPITAMTLAFAVASLSWLTVLAFPTLLGMAAAIAIFSVGETMQAPRFYEYVSSLAPRAQVGTFMGFAFLPVAIGALVAGWLSGELVNTYINTSRSPSGMWLTLCGVGLTATVLLLIYDLILVRRFPARTARLLNMLPSRILFSWYGRIGRGTFWSAYYALLIVTLIVGGVIVELAGTGPDINRAAILVYSAFLLLVTWVAMAIQAKRWQDVGLPGWLALLYFVPGVNVIGLLCAGALKGSTGANRYGEDPAEAAAMTGAPPP